LLRRVASKGSAASLRKPQHAEHIFNNPIASDAHPTIQSLPWVMKAAMGRMKPKANIFRTSS